MNILHNRRAIWAVTVGLCALLAADLAPAQTDCIDYADFPDLQAHVPVPGEALGLVCDGTHVFVAAGSAGLQVLDVSSPGSPVRIGGLDTPGQGLALDQVGDLVYVADGTSGLRIISVADPQSPALVGAIDTPGYVRNVKVTGDHAFLAVDFGYGLMSIDVSDPGNPVMDGYSLTGTSARDVEVYGDFAYLCDADGLTYVFDISTPAAPVQVNTVPTSSYGTAMQRSGDRLAMRTNAGFFVLFDLSSPADPMNLGNTPLENSKPEMAYDGARGYALTGNEVIVLDVGDPAAIRELTTLVLPDNVEAVAVGGDLVCAAMGAAGVQVIQDNGFELPLPVGTLPAAGNIPPGPFEVVNGYALVASDQLYVVVATNPANPYRSRTIPGG